MKRLAVWLLAGAFVLVALMAVAAAVRDTNPTTTQVCYGDCPTYQFHAERYVCPDGYKLKDGLCTKKDHDPVEPTLETFDVSVPYIKSEDPGKCHRPAPSSLDVPEWAEHDYNGDLPEHVDAEVISCPLPTATEVVEPTATEVVEPTATATLEPGEPTPTATVDPCAEGQCEPTATPTATEKPDKPRLPNTGYALAGEPNAWLIPGTNHSWAVHASAPDGAGYELVFWKVGGIYEFEGQQVQVTGTLVVAPEATDMLDSGSSDLVLITCRAYNAVTGDWERRLIVWVDLVE